MRTVGVAGLNAGAGEHNFSTPRLTPANANTPTSTMASGKTLASFSQESFFNGGYGFFSPVFELQEAFDIRYAPFEVLLAHAHGTRSTGMTL